jgi:hypothetical protein
MPDNDDLGQSFDPGLASRFRRSLSSPTGSSYLPGSALQVLSLFLPSFIGGSPIAPTDLLKPRMGGYSPDSAIRAYTTGVSSTTESPAPSSPGPSQPAPSLLGGGVKNGVVDLRTGVLRDGVPKDRITMSARVAYSPKSKAPTWDKTIRAIFDNDALLIDYMHRAFGYSLTGDCCEECAFMNYGEGANGKGTLINTIHWILGDYADNLSFSALELRDRSGGSASPGASQAARQTFRDCLRVQRQGTAERSAH